MKFRLTILSWVIVTLLPLHVPAQPSVATIHFNFYNDTVAFSAGTAASIPFNDSLSATTIRAFYQKMESSDYGDMVKALKSYQDKEKPDDWVYYQLVRRMAQSVSPKAENYNRYTLYKWFLLCKTGYDATLNIAGNRLLIYVRSNDEIYDIPCFTLNGKRYICLNYHDYSYNIDFSGTPARNININVPGAEGPFSYRLTHLPEFNPESYHEKELHFSYHDTEYRLRIKLNDDVKAMFANYPVVDYQLFFDAPLSRETYNSLITQLRKNTQKMSVTQGVEYLMYFTRYAFVYQADSEHFGREKHMSPEQTLLYESSDCADRSALFYCLVKEIYHLPMLVVAFPHHLTIAVKLEHPVGAPVMYNGEVYSFCEPTPQTEDLPLGNLSPELKTVAWQVVYSYSPAAR